MRVIAATVGLTVWLAASAVGAQPRFGVELGAGQNLGFTPYVDNVVLLQGQRPILVDELPGSGAAFDLRFIFSRWAVGGAVRLFDRETIVIHHRALEDLPSNRIRSDGSIDDAGIDYEAIDPIRSPSPQARPGDLLLIEMGAAHRFYVLDGALSVFFPLGGAVVGVKVLEVNQPTILGLMASTGFGASYDIAPPFGIFLQGMVQGVLTPAYRPAADTARTSFTAGESTEEAVLGTMGFGSALVGLQLTVR